jgi:general secretion pathway protein D
MNPYLKSMGHVPAGIARLRRSGATHLLAEAMVGRVSIAARQWVGPLACALLAACASSSPVPQSAVQSFEQGRVEEGLAQLQSELVKRPHDAELRVGYLTLKERAVDNWITQARSPALADNAGEQAKLYRRVLGIDPGNSRAVAGLEQIERDARLSKMLLDAQFAFDTQDYATASAKVRAVLVEDPLNARARSLLRTILDKTAKPLVDPALARALQKMLTIDFKEATVKQVFDVLSKTSGINMVLDKDIKTDQRVTLSLKEISVKDAIALVTLTNQLQQRPAGKNALLIYPNTPAKQKDYDELNVRTFFLANADAEQVASTLKTILKLRDVVVDKAQSAVMVRDTPSALQMAEKIVTIEDLPTPETMIEVEIMEVNRDRMTALGIQFPPSLTLTPLPSTTGGTLTLSDLKHLSLGSVGATLSSTVINASGSDSDLKTLANPRIRVRNRETAKILIGDRVPNITSTSTSTGFVSENIQYLDVGLKVELTPTISIDNEVVIKVSMEVSSVSKTITTSSGTTAYQIGTRSASTVLRLKDGENQILAGLINNQDTRTFNKIPGLGDLPIAGHLFGSDSTDASKSEIVLSITPRLVRNIPRPDAALLEFESGTDSSLHGPDGGGMAMPVSTSTQPAPAPVATDRKPAVTGPLTGSTVDTLGNGTALAGATAAQSGTSSGTGASANPVGWSWSGVATATVGSSVQQQLMLNTPQPVSSVSLTVGYDPAILQVTDVLEGNLLKADGTATTFTQRVDPSTGQLRTSTVRASTSTSGSVGQGSVATLNLTPLAASTASSLRVISVQATAPDGSTINLPLPAAQTLFISTKASPP